MNVDGGPLGFLLGMGSIRPCLVLLFLFEAEFHIARNVHLFGLNTPLTSLSTSKFAL